MKLSKKIKNYIRIERPPMSFKESAEIVKNKEKRKELIDYGENVANEYLYSCVNELL